jgi:hypothetical protein
MKKKTTLTNSEIVENKAKVTAQQWMPLKDIINAYAYTKDGYVTGYIMIQPYNLELFNEKEQVNKIGELSEILNGEESAFMWYCTDRPADLEPYLDDLKYKAEIANKTVKKILLGKYATTARNQVITGELVEKRFYMAIRLKNDKKIEILLNQKLLALVDGLSSIGLQVKIASEKEVYELFSMFSDPSSSLFDNGNYNSGIFPTFG